MQIIVQAHGMKMTGSLREYAQKKIGKIEQFFHNIQKVEIILDDRSNRDGDKSQVAEVSVWVAGKKVLRATAAGQDMYASIDLVFEKLEEQIKKHKAKHTDVQRRKAKKRKQALKQATGALPKKFDGPVLVRLSRPIGKPIHEEDAKLALKISNEEFHFYRDAKTHKTHVICKKGAKSTEIITPSKLKTIDERKAQAMLAKRKKIFLPFINSASGEINIIYRRNSGNYGLIEPRL